jgi:hypothetical protein
MMRAGINIENFIFNYHSIVTEFFELKLQNFSKLAC